VIDMLIL